MFLLYRVRQRIVNNLYNCPHKFLTIYIFQSIVGASPVEGCCYVGPSVEKVVMSVQILRQRSDIMPPKRERWWAPLQPRVCT